MIDFENISLGLGIGGIFSGAWIAFGLGIALLVTGCVFVCLAVLILIVEK